MTSHTHFFSDWPFADPPNTVSYSTALVARQGYPVLRVSHDWDGDWQFLDATTERPGECVLLCMGCVFERDPSLREVASLPIGWSAARPAPGADWQCWEMEPWDDEEESSSSC